MVTQVTLPLYPSHRSPASTPPVMSRGCDAASPERNRETPDGTASEASIEVVLRDEKGSTKVLDTPPRPASDQNVFRGAAGMPHHAMRPHPMRHEPPYHHYPYPMHSGSWGYGHPEYPPPPYPVSHYSSASFEEHQRAAAAAYHHASAHYTPHVHYPPPPAEGVNIISPAHRFDGYRPPMTPKSRMPPPRYYQYPPHSPVNNPSTSTAGPRVRQYAASRRGGAHADGGAPYSRRENTAWTPPSSQPPIVNETSFDSHSRGADTASHPPTPKESFMEPPPNDPFVFYGSSGTWNSFDSGMPPPPAHYYEGYYGPPLESPYSPYQMSAPFSPGGIAPTDSFPCSPYAPPPSYSFSYDEDERQMLTDYHPDRDSMRLKDAKNGGRKPSTSSNRKNDKNDVKDHMLLPKAAEEVDFDIHDPPVEPITPPSEISLCPSLEDVNSYDVICGRGGGTNSQIGNRRFRKLVQEFQPTYLLARRKEKPLLARSIVLIIRKRGGRFLKKDEASGELYEVGDTKAEAKTSQALREGLDVRSTKSCSSSKKKGSEDGRSLADSPPTLPHLDESPHDVDPPSPSQSPMQKRRRTRSIDPAANAFPDFLPPTSAIRRGDRAGGDDDNDSINQGCEPVEARGCASIAFDIVTGAAVGSFCLGPTTR